MLVNNGWSYATNTIIPWKWRYFKDKNVESRIPVTLVICQDTSKWINLIENLFSILLCCYVRGAISRKIPTHQMKDNYTVRICWEKKNQKAGGLFGPGRVSIWQLKLPRAISRLLCSRTDIFDDCFRLQAKLGFIIYWFIFQTFAN